MRKPRVCHFAYSFFPLVGGMEEVIHSLSISMLDQGWEPLIFTPRLRGRDNRLQVPYRVFRFQRPSSRRFGLRQILVPLLWDYFRRPFDVLHCHGVYPPGYVGASFSRLTGVPFVITPHGGDIKLTGQGFVINRRVTARIRKTLERAHAVTAISSIMRARLLALGARDERTHVVPNGVFSAQFRPSGKLYVSLQGKSPNGPPYVLYLGRLAAIKDVDILLQAFSKIIGNENVRLKIAGEGREMDNLKELAKGLGIAHRVDFLGMVRGEEKVHLLQNALFFVSPRIINNLGIANLEALSSGIPIITTKTEEAQKVIKDGENGFLVNQKSPEELAARMDLLLNDRGLREHMSGKALATASLFDWDNIVKDYIGIYEGVMRPKKDR